MAEERLTYCRLCEAMCGLSVSVEDGRVVEIRPDRAHPLSRGFACPKGIAMKEIQEDPDRVVHPLRRTGAPGEFERVSWEDALDDIGRRLRAAIDTHGRDAVGWFTGTPLIYSYAHMQWQTGFMAAMRSPHVYSSFSVDVTSRYAANALMYGHPMLTAMPDVEHTDFLVVVGANPMVSHGSLLTAPRLRDTLLEIPKRGGRVVVVDPRRTETARHFEHIAIRPDTDAWWLLSLLHVVFEEGLVDGAAADRLTVGADELRDLAADFPPETTASRTGVGADTTRELARAFARAPRGVFYGRCGLSLGRFSTLASFLLDALNAVTGNLDRPGGAVFGEAAVDVEKLSSQAGLATYDTRRTRVGNLPEVLGQLPVTVVPQEILTRGPGQIRAFFTSAGNPALTTPGGGEWERALEALDLYVSLDLYVNDTNRHADYVLPCTTWLERDDWPWYTAMSTTRPYAVWTDRVVEPRGEAREDWWIIDQIARRIGIVPAALPIARALGRLGIRSTPERNFDLLLRTGRHGDWFGLRRHGLSRAKLRRDPRGWFLADRCPTGVLPKRLATPDKRVHLAAPQIVADVERLASDPESDPAFPLRLISLRELRSLNSWLHNSPKLMARRRHTVRMHPDDAAARGLADGDRVSIASRDGRIESVVQLTDELMHGIVAVPQGWGHRGGWQRAVAAGGASYNDLVPRRPEDLDPLGAQAFFNGVPVEVGRLHGAAIETAGEAAPA